MAYFPLTPSMRIHLESRGTKIMDMEGQYGTTGDAVAHLVINEGMKLIVVYGRTIMHAKDSLHRLIAIAESLPEERIKALNGKPPLTFNNSKVEFCGARIVLVSQESISRSIRGLSPDALIYAWL